jgi:hypothetical protein
MGCTASNFRVEEYAKQATSTAVLFSGIRGCVVCSMLVLLFDPEDGGSTIL